MGVFVIDRHELHMVLLQHLPQLPEVRHAAGEPVQSVDIQRGDAVSADILHQLLEGGALGVFAGVAGILVDPQLPTARRAAAQVDLSRDGQAVLFLHGLAGVYRVCFHAVFSRWAVRSARSFAMQAA